MSDLIFSYSRAHALSDGLLIDVSDLADEAGFKVPVAITRSAWGMVVAVPDAVEAEQDEAGRLWDVLWMLRHAIRTKRGGDEIRYQLHVKQVPGEEPELLTLKAVCGPGDDLSPVLTIMLPEED